MGEDAGVLGFEVLAHGEVHEFPPSESGGSVVDGALIGFGEEVALPAVGHGVVVGRECCLANHPGFGGIMAVPPHLGGDAEWMVGVHLHEVDGEE